ncbi:DUF6286 domain-containing protein [Streptomyces lavendulae]|uniref:Uncharacterized protein n=1 Tax=Streptomyces lavendulae subsp. lavendulae TaxID=58340 RepID=A0A2K8PRS2_STRLA|nr:DUF6286 domain-containing protein [Streptomyces lavendulae]ATZ29399.1 hypothetical protein SLAV_38175 [Streptomyces lavendulae subsp. lavendulae]QUQ59206.1 hypothetical protein SLLC_36310 [Streptomyces lavendulae subsp. lavendulae]
MEREQDPLAEKEPTETDEATFRTVGLLDERPPAGPHSAARRPWSARRIPAALTALIIAVAAGTLLFDVIRVRTGQAAAGWRIRLADELAARPLDDPALQIGAAVIAIIGLWLIILALSPGLRHQLPLETPDAKMRAVLDREAAELKLRDAAMRVPGVSAAKVRFFQHRIKARADVRFRAPLDVKADLSAALQEALDRLALARPPSLDVRVRPRHR